MSPTDPPSTQWRVVLNEEVDAASNPQDRVPSWNSTVEQTRRSHPKHREILRDLVNLPQGTTVSLRFADASIGAQAIIELSKAFLLNEFPKDVKNPGRQLVELAVLVRDAKETDRHLPKLPSREFARLEQLANNVNGWLRGLSVRDHLLRVCKVVETVSSTLPSATPVAVSEWNSQLTELREFGFVAESQEPAGRDVEAFIDEMLWSETPRPEDLAEFLDWLLRSPVRPLNILSNSMQVAERTISELHRYVAEFLNERPATAGSFHAIQEAGCRTVVASNAVLSGMSADVDG